MSGRFRVWLCALAAVFVSLPASQARAQSFPTRPVHLIVGVSPGGSTDVAARLIAKSLSTLWGEPVVVETRLGAAGAVAYEFVAKAPADGYTLLITSDNFTATSALRSDLPYKLSDFTPVSLVATSPAVLTVTPSLPVHNIRELIALAKSEPGKLTYGSSGVGSTVHLNTALFASMAGIDIVHVPYQGTTASMVGAADGEIDMSMGAIPAEQSLSDAGKLRVIAITTLNRSPLAPTIPTINESGVPGYSFADWYGVFGPAGLPKDVLATLSAGIAKVAQSPEMKAALAKQGVELQTEPPAAFAKIVNSDLDDKKKMVKLVGLKSQ